MTLWFFYKLSFPCEFNLSSLSCISATMNMILSAWSYFCWILFVPRSSPSLLQASNGQVHLGYGPWWLVIWEYEHFSLVGGKKTQNVGKDCGNLNCIFTRKRYNPNITLVKSIQCLRESESHQWWWMNQLTSRLEEMATSQTQQEGNEAFTHFWIYKLIFKPKDKKAEAKQYENQVKDPCRPFYPSPWVSPSFE